MKSADVLKEIASQVSACEKCGLYHSRKKAVPGEGPANSEIMFIGEGPGFYENEQGRPFVGAAGQFLSELLSKINLKREQVLHYQRGQMPPAGQPRPAARRTGGLLRLPGTADRSHQPARHRHPGALFDGALSAHVQDFRYARAGLVGARAAGGGHVPSRRRAAPAVAQTPAWKKIS